MPLGPTSRRKIIELRRHEIIEALTKGPRTNFGSDKDTDRALQGLRKTGRIRYRKVRDGGKGWELVPASDKPEGES